MKRRSVIFATWGNPFIWNEANYRISGSKTSVKGVTTIYLLIKELSPDLVVLMVPETLLCDKKVEEYGGRTIPPGINEDEYRNLVLDLRNSIKNFFRRKMPEDLEAKDPEVVIMPNVGEYYSENIRVEWRLPEGEEVSPDSAYAAHALISAVSSLIEVGKSADFISLYFDTTHGVNFMPLAAYRALMAASRIASAFYGLKIEFKQYNSTPYPSRARSRSDVPSMSYVPDLEVFVVKREVITPVKAAQRLVYSYLSGGEYFRLFFSKNGMMRIPELEEFRNIHKRAKALASSIHYSIPLAFIQFSVENYEYAGKLEGYIRRIKELLEEALLYTSITKKDEKLCIEHKIVPNYDYLKSLLSAFSLISYGNNSLGEIRIQDGIVEVPLSKLESAMRYLQGPLAEVAKHEISHFIIEGYIPKELKEMMRQAKEDRGNWKHSSEKCEDNRRTVIAHAGLPHRSIEVMFNGEIWVRYRKDCLEYLRDLIKDALEETKKMIKGEKEER